MGTGTRLQRTDRCLARAPAARSRELSREAHRSRALRRQTIGARNTDQDARRRGFARHWRDALIIGNRIEKTGGWGTGDTLAKATSDTGEVFTAGRRGLVREFGGVEVAYEVLMPAVALVICGSGPDVVPLARLATELGWT